MDFKLEIANEIAKHVELGRDEIADFIEAPANDAMGDFAFPCFRLAKALKKAPPAIAEELAGKITPDQVISKVQAVSGYLNFFINKEALVKNVVGEICDEAVNYGESAVGNGKTIVIDYSSPNIAKPFHVGHLRSTVIGNALYNIHKALGYTVVGINHLGDWGTQFGKMIVAYKNWGDDKAIDQGGIRELVKLYVKFHEEAEQDESLNDAARTWLLKMQEGDEEAVRLWQWLFSVSMEELKAIYKRLNIEFDDYTGESFYNDKMDAIVNELKEKGLLVESEGAQVVDLSEYNMPPCLILRSDGGTLYPTRDIAAAKYRKEKYDFTKCLYITGLEQNLHFAQWFKVIELMGYNWAEGLVHIPFGLVSLESGKLSTRKGNVIFMEDLLNEAVSKTLAIIEQKNPDLENKEVVAEQVGIGAIIFNDLYNGRIKDVTFSWDKMLNFDGETAPYVQYTHARACSLLSKAGDFKKGEFDAAVLNDKASVEVVKLLYTWPDKLEEAAGKYEPFVLTRHLVDIAQAFNRFYHDNPILVADEAVKSARLHLVYCVRNTIRYGLGLIGIHAPEQM